MIQAVSGYAESLKSLGFVPMHYTPNTEAERISRGEQEPEPRFHYVMPGVQLTYVIDEIGHLWVMAGHPLFKGLPEFRDCSDDEAALCAKLEEYGNITRA